MGVQPLIGVQSTPAQLQVQNKTKSARISVTPAQTQGHGSRRKQRNRVAYHAGIVAPACPQLNVAPIPGDGALVAGDGCSGLEGHADHNVLPIGDAALDTTRPAAGGSACQNLPVLCAMEGLPAWCLQGMRPWTICKGMDGRGDWTLRSLQVANSTHAALISRLIMSLIMSQHMRQGLLVGCMP